MQMIRVAGLVICAGCMKHIHATASCLAAFEYQWYDQNTVLYCIL